jgi:hypothetical protein
VGNNSFNGVTGYSARPGWDACTGFGSFDAAKLIACLSRPGVGSVSVPQRAAAPQPMLVRGTGRPLPPPPQGDREFLVRVQAVIQKVEQDVHHNGAYHHHLLVDQIQVLKVWNGTQLEVGDTAFVAIRYGDDLGLSGPIPGLLPGKTIELQGRYIPKKDAYPSVDNPGDPVIDETHHPFGFVVYEGQLYR